MPAQEVIYLVACVGKKLSDPAPARELYISPWFIKARRYVEASGFPWFILSAKYHLVNSDDVIAPYDQTLSRMGVTERRVWAEELKRQMTEQLPFARRIVVLAGIRYRENLMSFLEGRAKVSVPMEGMRIGKQLRWLNNH